MSSQIDFRTLPANVPSVCIPRVYPNINESRIRKIFEDLTLGIIDRIDIIGKTTDKKEKFNRVFIHFKRWFTDGNAEIARERLLNGKDIKIIYDEPWFWKVSAYREPPSRPAPRQIAPTIQTKPTIQFDSDDEKKKPCEDRRPRGGFKKFKREYDNRRSVKQEDITQIPIAPTLEFPVPIAPTLEIQIPIAPTLEIPVPIAPTIDSPIGVTDTIESEKETNNEYAEQFIREMEETIYYPEETIDYPEETIYYPEETIDYVEKQLISHVDEDERIVNDFMTQQQIPPKKKMRYQVKK
jgi:hypothetical protein